VATTKRLYYLDNLRVALTVLVIAHHVGQAYGPTGGYWPIQEAARAAILAPFFTVNRSFFMSLFFMISGYLVVMSCDSKEPWAFLKGRLLRLGIPVAVFGLLMVPLQLFVFSPGSPWPGFDVGHLWFLEHLLIFSACYALWRIVRPAPSLNPASRLPATCGQVAGSPAPLPGYFTILGLALALAVVTAVVRIWFPIDRWITILGFIRTAFADVPRDLTFFILGAVAYRRQWFERFPGSTGRVWLGVGVLAAVLMYAYQMGLYRVLPLRGDAWGIAYPIWEMLLCCGMCIGLLVLFRDHLNTESPLSRALGRSQYAAYIFHVPVVLLFQLAVVSLALPPLAKFTVVTLVSVPATFWFSNWVRKPLYL